MEFLLKLLGLCIVSLLVGVVMEKVNEYASENGENGEENPAPEQETHEASPPSSTVNIQP